MVRSGRPGREAAAHRLPGPAAGGHQPLPTAALLLIAAVTVLWGVNWPVMKVAVGELSPWLFRSVCIVIAGGCLMTLAVLSGETVRPRRDALPWLTLTAFFSVTCWNLFSAFGLRHMGGGHGAILAYTMPVWTALLAIPLLGERIDRRKAGALMLGMAGVAILAGPELARGSMLGPLFMLLAAIAWAAGIVTLKLRPTGLGAVALTAWQMILGGIPVILATLVVEPVPDLGHLTWRGIAATLYAAVVGLSFCFAAYNRIVLMLPAGVAAISVLMIPAVGVFSSALLLGEPLGMSELLSLVLVVAAVGLVLLPRRAA